MGLPGVPSKRVKQMGTRHKCRQQSWLIPLGTKRGQCPWVPGIPFSCTTPFSPTTPASAGYSLIEMLVVITLLIMMSLTATSLFLNTLTGSNKTSINLTVKQQGEYAMSQMVAMIRNAVRIDSCSSGSMTILNQDGLTTTFSLSGTQLASNSGIYLTGPDVYVSQGPVFVCTESNDVYTFANISFSLKKGDPQTDKAIDIVEQQFTTGVGVREY